MMVKSRAPANMVIGLSDKHLQYFALFDSTGPQNSGPENFRGLFCVNHSRDVKVFMCDFHQHVTHVDVVMPNKAKLSS